MKKFFKILLILILIAAYFNIGYWGGKSDIEGTIRFYAGKKINRFQKFQLSYGKIGTAFDPPDKHTNIEKSIEVAQLWSIVIWPFGLFISLAGWAVYGVVLLFKLLYNFFFLGGFFKLLKINSGTGIVVTTLLFFTFLLSPLLRKR